MASKSIQIKSIQCTHTTLTRTPQIMIRRLKKAVLTQLPDKIRQRVTVEVPADKLKAMKVRVASCVLF